MILEPAYGRDYRSKKAVLDDFLSEKDFILNDLSSQWDGKYINRQQIPKGTAISFRYAKKTKSFPVTVGKEPSK